MREQSDPRREMEACRVASMEPVFLVGVDEASRPQSGASAAAEGGSGVANPPNRDGGGLKQALNKYPCVACFHGMWGCSSFFV